MNVQLPENFQFPPGYVHPESVEDAGDGLHKITFPGGFACFVKSDPGEAALIYNEVIVQGEYFQAGLSVAQARCVIDIGANIGIFTMAVKMRNPEAAVYAFEAIPDTFQVLEKNVDLLGCSDVHLYNAALGAQDGGEVTLTFFPHMPGNSTAVPSLKEENRPVMDHIFGKELSDFLHQTETRTVQARTLSSVIREAGISAVDYLKLDVEGGEISVLQGIDGEHWSIIDQVAVEAHTSALRDQVCEILERNRFEVFSDLGLSAPGGASMVYARRRPG